jgi:hypothetical protein
MKLLDFKSFILESASFKKKEDFSGKKWGAQLMGSRVYNFKSGGQDYILDFTVEQYNPIDKNNFSYVLRFDIRTKKKEFELIKSENPFELSSTVKEIYIDTLKDLKEHGYKIDGLKIYYSREPNETKNVRSIFFNRAINSALKDLGIKYDYKDYIDTKVDKHVSEYTFK